MKVETIFKKLKAPMSMIGNTADIDIGNYEFNSFTNNEGVNIIFHNNKTPTIELEVNHETHMLILRKFHENDDNVEVTVWKYGKKNNFIVNKNEL